MVYNSAFPADELQEILTTNQREVNTRSRALPVTADAEVRSSANMDYSASELMLVCREGDLSTHLVQ